MVFLTTDRREHRMQSATQAPPTAALHNAPPLLRAAREAVRAAERAAHGLLFAVRAEGDGPGRYEALEALAVACAGRVSDAGAHLAELEREGLGGLSGASPDGPTSVPPLSVYEHLASLADSADVPPETAEACGVAAGALAEAMYRVADDAEAAEPERGRA